MKCSDNTAKLDAALAAAQSEMRNPALDGANPHFRSRFTTLQTALREVRPILAKHAIALVQASEPCAEGVAVYTRLSHAGEWLVLGGVWPLEKRTPQAVAAATTYARRVSLCAAVGIAGDDDDDGEQAEGRAAPRAETNGPVSGGSAVDALIARVRDAIESGDITAFEKCRAEATKIKPTLTAAQSRALGEQIKAAKAALGAEP